MSKHYPSFEQALQEIHKSDAKLKAFISLRQEKAQVEYEQMKNSGLPLAGVPFSLKDVWDVANEKTTGGSWRYRDRVPAVSSPVCRLFQEAGAVLVGKSSCSDLSVAPESGNYLTGASRNPHDHQRTTGGSSSGAAAATATGMSAFDWGTDIGGSIRMPAGFCGVFGMRLSRSTWPMLGYFPRPPEAMQFMEGQGPITQDLGLMKKLLELATPVLKTGPSEAFTFQGLALYAPDHCSLGDWPSFQEDVIPKLSSFDTILVGDQLPPQKVARDLYAEVWSSHFDDLRESDTLSLSEGLTAVASSLLFRGKLGDLRIYHRTAELLALMAIGRHSFYRDKGRALAKVQDFQLPFYDLWRQGRLIITPTSTFSPPRLNRWFYNFNLLNCVVPGNLTDATALAIPWGQFANGLPRSLQIMGPPGSELQVLAVGEKLGQILGPH
jgi:Asp-tRNA(Asn)/Glu-tRNA(Gln) amidotransferase A subunit family amidase